jgi:hypothetical protein
MKDRIRAFMDDLDVTLQPHANGETLIVYHIGRSALVWDYDYAATTSDIDLFRPKGDQRLIEIAMKSFGRGVPKAIEHGLYLDPVDDALPPAPAGCEKRARQVAGQWQVLRIYHLERHDLAATKMRRFAPKDREDIRMLCDLGLLEEKQLEETLEKAFRFNLDKDGDPYRDSAFANLAVVQRYLRGEIREF